MLITPTLIKSIIKKSIKRKTASASRFMPFVIARAHIREESSASTRRVSIAIMQVIE